MEGGQESQPWLILVYKIPPEPSRHRVAVWRRLKEAGAIYLQNSISVLPRSQRCQQVLQDLQGEIAEAGGESFLLVARALDAAEQDMLVERFNAERNEEYRELLEQCDVLLGELEKEARRENFSFGELEENEGNLHRLQTWLDKVKDRDHFGAPGGRAAGQRLQACRQQLEGFAAKVFAAQLRSGRDLT